MSTAAQLATKVRQRVGVTSADGAASDTIVFGMLNAAVKRVALMHDWPWLEASETISVTAGTNEYTPGNTWRTTLRLYRDGYPDLEYRQPRDMQGFISDGQTGPPLMYTVERGKIVLAPIPDTSYTLTHVFIRTETEIDDAADVPLVPTWAEDLVVAVAAHMLAASMRDSGLMKMLEAEARDMLAVLRDEVRRSRAFPKPKRRKDVWL